ncbi:MAG: hypothetical protein H7328_06575 [Bdellovibrio sp.]|nr:hypothetical protein [Bdellovibrio sp.]
MKQKIILAICLLLAGCTTPLKERNISSLSNKEIDRLWVVVDKKQRKDSLIRSNPQHFWAWMEANSQKQMNDLLKYEGAITADPHFFNFADVHASGGQNGLALVDVDDSGTGPFILDFVRYSLFVKAYVKDQHGQTDMAQLIPDMYDMYVKGLSQEKVKAPKVFQNVINQSYAKLNQENAAWVDKNLDNPQNKDFGLRKKEIGLLDISKERKQPAKDLQKALLDENKVKEIYDIGFTVNDSGSSRGLSRYWLSVRLDKNTRRIIECKQLSRPATDYYETQKDNSTRIANVLKYYSDVQIDDSYVMNIAADSYWCRPREFKFIRRGDIENLSKADMKELSLYLAYWIGSKQSLQPGAKGYLSTLKKNNDTSDRVDKLINNYERNIDSLSPGK